jgi:hypothetical protein
VQRARARRESDTHDGHTAALSAARARRQRVLRASGARAQHGLQGAAQI